MADATYNSGTGDNQGVRKEERVPSNGGSFLLEKLIDAKEGDVVHEEFNEKGELIGFAMLMQRGTIPLTAQELSQLLHR